MNAAAVSKRMTVEEYLQLEEASIEKHDFIDGVVYAMAGADFSHNQISSNAHISIGSFLQGKPCRIYGSDLKVHVKTKSDFAYPDLTIVCNAPQFFSGKKGIVTNPSVIIEVLSPETERYDRGKKFMLYRQIESLQEYILISSTEVLAERYKKAPDGTWSLTDSFTLNDVLSVETIDYKITLAQLYRDVVFEEDDAADGQAQG